MKKFGKITAGILAAAAVLTMSGCADNGYIMTVEGVKIRNGVYLSFQQDSFSEASNRISESAETDEDNSENSTVSTDDSTVSTENSTETAEEEKYYNKIIDGQPWEDWVKDYTMKAIRRFVGIQKQCEEFGIELSSEELSDLNKSVENTWNSADIYMQYIYGITAMSQYYENVGIGLDSLKEIAKVNALNEKLFYHYYGEGGELAPSQEDYDKFVSDNYAAYRLLTLQYLNDYGDPLVTDEEKAEVDALAQEYADRLNDGEAFVDVKYDNDLITAQRTARAEADEEYTEDNEDGLTREEYIQKAVDEVEVEAGDDDHMNDEVLYIEDDVLSEDLQDYIFSLPNDGKTSVFKGESGYVYVVTKLSMDDLENWEESSHDEVLYHMFGEDYDGMMDIMCQNYTVDVNSWLVDHKYSPRKMYERS